jgi:hypothetical protein
MNTMACLAGHHGLLQGLWDGATAPITLFAGLFFDVTFYDVCATSWWYKLGFSVAFAVAAIIGFMDIRVATIVFVVCFAAFVIWFVFANILYILAFIVLCAIVLWLYEHRPRKRGPFRQRDGSTVLPP